MFNQFTALRWSRLLVSAWAPKTLSACTLALILTLAFSVSSCSRTEVSPESYFPLNQGLSWNYALNFVMLDGKKSSQLEIRNLGESVFTAGEEELRGVVRRTSDGTDYLIQSREDGYYRVGKRVIVQTRPEADKQPRLVLPQGRNLRTGFIWTLETSPYVMHWMPPFVEANASIKPFDMVYEIASLNETVETPAGVFEKCIRVNGTGKMVFYADASAGYQEILINHSEWYAPGVGLVKLERDEPLDSPIMKGGKVTMMLTRFSQ